MGLTVAQVVSDLRLRLGIMPGATSIPAGANADCIMALNWALQVISKSNAQYFKRETIDVTLVIGQQAYLLPADTMDVIGPVITNAKRTLRTIENFSDIQGFGQIFFDQAGVTVANGAPLVYHVRDTKTLTESGDSHAITLHVLPAPDSAAVSAHSPVKVDGVRTCPRYTEGDIASTTVVPISDGYTESILLPLARLQVTRSHIFSQTEQLSRIKEDASTAMKILGVDNGEDNADSAGGAQQ